jgi:hypothetical protein
VTKLKNLEQEGQTFRMDHQDFLASSFLNAFHNGFVLSGALLLSSNSETFLRKFCSVLGGVEVPSSTSSSEGACGIVRSDYFDACCDS